ncbi:MAG: hypothetical protein R3D02_15875 [Hyphomicrobiales bacterium]
MFQIAKLATSMAMKTFATQPAAALRMNSSMAVLEILLSFGFSANGCPRKRGIIVRRSDARKDQGLFTCGRPAT